MFRLTLVAALGAAAAALTIAATAGAMTHPKLIGLVGKNDAYTITLKDHGKLVKTIKHGTYTFVISDDSAIHNYELDGPHGKSWVFTSVPFKGTKTKALKLCLASY